MISKQDAKELNEILDIVKQDQKALYQYCESHIKRLESLIQDIVLLGAKRKRKCQTIDTPIRFLEHRKKIIKDFQKCIKL